MKNVYILTVWDAPNYGSFLQANSLKVFFENKGYKVSFIQYRTDWEEIKFLFNRKKQFIFHPLFCFKRFLNFKKNQKRLHTIKLKDAIRSPYDYIIIGSDEIWSVVNDPYFSKEYFYGKGFDFKKVITYSVSLGSSTLKDFEKYSDLLNCIKSLESNNVSVRDNRTLDFVKTVKNVEFVQKNCDPTFLIDKNINVDKYQKKLPDRFMVVYSYEVDEKLQQFIKKFAKEKELKIVSLCNYFSFCDYNIPCSPLEFSDIISKSEYVVVTTFHGTIFSILNQKKFVSFTDKQKTIDVLNNVSLSERLLNSDIDYDQFKSVLDSSIDYKKVKNSIENMKKNSIDWINNILK